MLGLLIRFAKRIAVLAPGLVIAYVSIFNIFPWFNQHLPVAVAIIITYVLGAYVLVPAIIRGIRIVLPPKHLPLYCITADGFASDPLNIALIGTRQQVIDAMTTAGWHQADRITIRTVARLLLSTVYGWRYDSAPMSHLYLFGRAHDLGFQAHIQGARPGSRHHVRFWAATFQEGKELSVQSIHWQNRQAHIRDDRLLWIGAASRDVGVAFIRHNAQLTHLVDPNTDEERDLIAGQLQHNGLARLERRIKLDEPYKLLNIHALYGHLNTDGQMAVLEITKQTATQDPESSPRKHSQSPRPRAAK